MRTGGPHSGKRREATASPLDLSSAGPTAGERGEGDCHAERTVVMAASTARHRPVHFSVADGCYFISAATLYHQPLLHSPTRRGWFVECVQANASHFNLALVAWVVLPDHY